MADAWALLTDVTEITGVTVTAGQLAQAQAQIEVRIGRLGAATSRIGTADLMWLKRAVSYQAAWLKANPDVVSRMDVTQFNQDGASATVRGDGLVLAPLAKRALRHVSWRGTRSVHTDSVYSTGGAPFYPAAEGVVAIMEDTDRFDRWAGL